MRRPCDDHGQYVGAGYDPPLRFSYKNVNKMDVLFNFSAPQNKKSP
jgi:hypothetical protein